MAAPAMRTMSPIGNPATAAASLGPRRAFTLVELLLVMALLTIVFAVSAPSLARFFRGRDLDYEARQFVSLTRYAQSRAVSEGIPMVLWLDVDGEPPAYGLAAETTYEQDDGRAVEFTLGENLALEVDLPATAQPSTPWRVTTETAGANTRAIRFTPDGFIGDNSPERIVFRQVHERDNAEVWIELTPTRMSYEVQTNQTLRGWSR